MHRSGSGASRFLIPGRLTTLRALDRSIELVLIGLCGIFVVWPILAFILHPVINPQANVGVLDLLTSNQTLLMQSVAVAALTSVISTGLALAVGLVVVFAPRWFSRVTTALVGVSLISPPFVASLAYIELFGRRGLITHGLLGLSISPYGWQGVVCMQALFFCALNVMLIVSVLQRADKNLLMAAADLGASNREVFWDVLFPLIRPALGVCLLLTFVRSLLDYATPVVIGGKFDTLATEIYVRLVGFSDLSSAAFLNLLLFACSILGFIVLRHYERGADVSHADIGVSVLGSSEESGFSFRGSVALVATVLTAGFLLFLTALYACILHAAFSRGMGWKAKLTLANFTHLVEFNLDSLGRSIWFALCCAAIATILGFVAAVVIMRKNPRGSWLLDFITTVPYTLPGLCLGLGFILAFNQPPIELVGTNIILVAVLSTKELAVSTRAFTSALAQVPQALDAAAQDLGATWPEIMGQILAPQVKQAAAVSLVNAFSSAMVSYSAVLFLVAPGNKTAIFELFDALSSGKYGQAAAISVVLIGITCMVNIVLWCLVFVGRRARVFATSTSE